MNFTITRRITFGIIFLLISSQLIGNNSPKELSPTQDSIIQHHLQESSNAKNDIAKVVELCEVVNIYANIDSLEAKTYLEEVQKLISNSEEPNIKILDHWALSNYYAGIGLFSKAETSLKKYLTQVHVFNENMMTARAHWLMSKIMLYTQEEKKGNNHADTLLSLVQDQPGQEYQLFHAKAIGLKGSFFRMLNQPEKALEFTQRAIELKKELGDKSYGSEYLTKANTYYIMGKIEEALDGFIEAAKAFEKEKNFQGAAKAFINTSILYNDMRDIERENKYLKQALENAKKSTDQSLRSRVFINLSSNEINQGNFEAAVSYGKQALASAQAIDYKRSIAQAYNRIADAYGEFNHVDSAEYYYQKCFEYIDQNPNSNLTIYKAFAQMAYGAFLHDLGRHPEAIIQLERYVDWEKSSRGNISLLGAYEKILAESYAQVGAYKKAFSSLESSMVNNDSLLNRENIRKATERDKDFEFQIEKEKTDILHQAEIQQKNLIQKGLIGGLALTGLLLFLVFKNYRDKQKANQAISLQKEQLEHLNQTKDQIFAIIGHDLRKPALSFRGIAKKVNYLLKKQDFKTLNALGEQIEQDAVALNKLTDNLLKWALTQKNVMPYRPDFFHISYQVEEVIGMFSNIAKEKQIQIESHIPDDLQVFADMNSFQTIIRNLMDNALKYTPQGGKIILDAITTDQGVKIQISDTGVGMSDAQLKDIFLLQKGKSQDGTSGEKGTGLGMHLVNELIQLNKGKIKIASQLGKGTTFDVLLPKNTI